MTISEEEFEEWRQHPVTEWIFACIEKFAGEQKARWADIAWTGKLDEILLMEARTRADCYMSLKESSHADWKAIDDSED